MAKIKKVGSVVLGVRDPQRSIPFDTEVLGERAPRLNPDRMMQHFSPDLV
jgi:hypothetical protein